jgi:16S rRNA (guanine527-N7)-methyltransferase
MTRAEALDRRHAAPRSTIAPSAPTLPDAVRSKLAAYLDLLAKWNRVYNLTAIRERPQMESHHVEDALAVLPWLPDVSGMRLLDIGSGGGIPGIPLAIARPDCQVVLLDANGKKVTFLTQAIIELGLANASAVASRIEDYHADARFDVVIARAFSDLRSFAVAARGHVNDGGVIVAMKGALPVPEIDALPGDIAVLATPALDVPGVAAERHLVIMRPLRGECL